MKKQTTNNSKINTNFSKLDQDFLNKLNKSLAKNGYRVGNQTIYGKAEFKIERVNYDGKKYDVEKYIVLNLYQGRKKLDPFQLEVKLNQGYNGKGFRYTSNINGVDIDFKTIKELVIFNSKIERGLSVQEASKGLQVNIRPEVIYSRKHLGLKQDFNTVDQGNLNPNFSSFSDHDLFGLGGKIRYAKDLIDEILNLNDLISHYEEQILNGEDVFIDEELFIKKDRSDGVSGEITNLFEYLERSIRDIKRLIQLSSLESFDPDLELNHDTLVKIKTLGVFNSSFYDEIVDYVETIEDNVVRKIPDLISINQSKKLNKKQNRNFINDLKNHFQENKDFRERFDQRTKFSLLRRE